MKYGLEQEFFVKNGEGSLIGALPAVLTPDDCGFLAEARGQPYTNIREAVFSLLADVHRLQTEAVKLGFTLVCEPNADVPFKAIMESRRAFSKGTLSFQNLYGHESHKEKRKKTAGIHISFTEYADYACYRRGTRDNEFVPHTFNYQPNWDWVQLFRHLDHWFKDEIKAARRNPGFYELKEDGRIEYRSLPNDVDPQRIITAITHWEDR